MKKYRPSKIESKWQRRWLEEKIFQPDLANARRPFYNLMMFPYPSAEGLHVGNMYAFTGADIYGRFKRMHGFDVFEPIGLDGFGIHSENYALKIGEHPAKLAKKTQKNFYRQLHATGNAYAWDNILETYDPNYYKWTQWIFVQMFKNGLAYRKKAAVNWCPNCRTTLSDEQVISGACERCKTVVEKRELEQWFFKITDYADRLLDGLSRIDWSERVKIAQRNWIGKSEGVLILFKIVKTRSKIATPAKRDSKKQIEVFTTAHDTIYGATFMLLSSEHPLVKELAVKTPRGWQAESHDSSEVEEKEKSGFFTGFYCMNPFNNEKIPIWIANYVLMEYGTGAVMGVPGHDARDHEFAQKYGLSIRPVIKPTDKVKNKAKVGKDGFWDYEEIKTRYATESIVYNSDILNGLSSQQAKAKIEREVKKRGLGKRQTQYHLRDWCVSRQRYWGPPIPMIYCQRCHWRPVLEKDLPVLLPDVADWRPKGEGASPLARHKDWLKVACPKCGGPAQRETDVSDTFLDSAWYFLRYPSLGDSLEDRSWKIELEDRNIEFLKNQNIKKSKIQDQETPPSNFKKSDSLPWDPQITKKWLPVNMYIGGAEHSVLHLMYSRFLTMVFKDLGLIDFEEPFKEFYAHGLLIAEGVKMSKSRGNIIIPDTYIKAYGADTLRCYLMFLGPFDQGGDFRDTGIAGMWRFLNRVWRLVNEIASQGNTSGVARRDSSDGEGIGERTLERLMHKTIKEVTEDIENLRYNTAIAKIMEYVNKMAKVKSQKSKVELLRKAMETLVLLLGLFAPHLAEELWYYLHPKSYTLNPKYSIHTQPWPKYDKKWLEEETVTMVIEVNGKLRDKLSIRYEVASIKQDVEQLARESVKIKKYLVGKKVKQVVFVPAKLINFVI